MHQISEGLANEDELDFWDEKFCIEAKIISQKREEVIDFFNQILSEVYIQISDNKADVLKLNFQQNYDGELSENLKRFRRREVGYGGTIFGPHRDELVFNLNGFNMANFASRGELKSAVLSLKVSELKFLEKSEKLKQKLGQKKVEPLLLLDDIFAEFDDDRQKHLSDLIFNYQAIITTTNKKNLPAKMVEKAKVLKLEV